MMKAVQRKSKAPKQHQAKWTRSKCQQGGQQSHQRAIKGREPMLGRKESGSREKLNQGQGNWRTLAGNYMWANVHTDCETTDVRCLLTRMPL